jgi:hypothetical protein
MCVEIVVVLVGEVLRKGNFEGVKLDFYILLGQLVVVRVMWLRERRGGRVELGHSVRERALWSWNVMASSSALWTCSFVL